MGKDELKKEIILIREFRENVSSTKEKAIESLEEAGICNSKGELAKEYK